MKTNEQLQIEVQNAIKWKPLLHAAEIGVTVVDGVVTLSGKVDNYMKKVEAETVAKNVGGVKLVIEKIEVEYDSSWAKKEDNDIADEIINAFKWKWAIPSDKIKVKVEKGWVFLQGTVSWNYQKEAAKNAVKNLLGVTGVSNSITIASETQNAIEKREIESALERNWTLDNDNVEVDVSGTKVRLTGTIRSLYQKEVAGRIAWNAKGVWTFDNELEIEYDYALT